MTRLSQVLNAEKRWARIKSNPEKYKAHLERQRMYMRAHPRTGKQKEYKREMKKVALDVGNCPQCFQPKEDLTYKICAKCRKYHRDYYNAHKKKKKEAKK